MSFRCKGVIVVFAVLAVACTSSRRWPAIETDAGQSTADVAAAIDTTVDSASSVDSVSPGDTTEPIDTVVDAGPEVPTCVATGAPGKDFDQSATGSDPYEKVGDFTISSLDGPVTLSKLWTGCDGHMFVIYHPDSKYASYAGAIWNSNPSVVFNQAPKDTHWYFLSYSSGDQAKQDVSTQRDKWLDALSKLSDEEQAHWKPRLHFIPVNAWQLPGWIGQTLKKKAVFHFGIDALQRRREIGLARPPMGNQPGNLRHLMFETQWYAWELKTRHQIDTLPDKKTVTIFDQVPVQSGWGGKKKFVDVDMPSAEELATYDGAHLEIAHGCDGGLDSNCPDWDRETSLFVCDVPKDDTEPAPMACVATQTQDCSCLGADGKTRTAKRKCKKDLSGFGACNCACTEFARQISTYKRHGWWLTDVSSLMPLLKAGGKQRFAYLTVDKWITTAKLHLFKKPQATRPYDSQYLWNGGQYNEKYNDAHKPITVTVPDDAKKARVVVLLSGHGSGTDTLNCAEFCPHSHHFSIGPKGGALKEFVKTHNLVQEGCLKKVPLGVVPNQFGTWPYDRAGWCPGWDVKLWTAELDVKGGQELEIQYKSLMFGKTYVPKPAGSGDYKPVIKMRSWLVWEK